MKPPKIGDIVWYRYRGYTYPAIVLSFKESLPIKELIIQVFGAINSPVSLPYESTHWSWPEEETPKECEHVIPGYTNVCWKCAKEVMIKENPQSKAEELIEKISDEVNKCLLDIWDYKAAINEISMLIKYYKGTK